MDSLRVRQEDFFFLLSKYVASNRREFVRNLEKGNVVNWETARFDLLNMTEQEVSMEAVCQPVKPGHVVMGRRVYADHVSLCKKFRAKTSIVTSAEVQRELSEIYLKTPFCSIVGSE